MSSLFASPTAEVRAQLLGTYGIGPETADSMLLYAGGHASFVIDAYTRRIFHRHGWCRPQAAYDELQQLCASGLNHLPPDRRLDYWQDFHAQMVRVGSQYCRPRNPRCAECPLRSLLPPAR